MDAADLNQEADALARPCVYLRTEGTRYAGVWTTASPGGPHVLFDGRWIPSPVRDVEGCFEASGGGTIRFTKDAVLPTEPNGKKLYAHPAVSLPPVDALIRFGSEPMRAWLADENPQGASLLEAYEQRYQEQLPLYTGGAHAVLGGWHFPWPDGDWDELADAQLVVWTFGDAEPWLEGWARADRLWLIERIT